MARAVVEFVGGPFCGRTDNLRDTTKLPKHIGPYKATGLHIGKHHYRYDYQPVKPATHRPPCVRHTTPQPGCPGYQP